jgi:DNA-binding CsgD family transcriptional regulator
VIGRVTRLSTLARLVELPEEEVENRLRPAFDQHVLEVRHGNTVGFRHPALREVVYAELLPAERARWHRAAAQALTSADQENPTAAGEVARHWYLAGDLPAALVASVRAGHAAERIYAFADAKVCFTRAAELLDAVAAEPGLEATEVARLSRPVLLEHAAQAASLIGDHAEAVHLTTEALADVHDPAARAHLLERLGAFEFIAGRGDRAQAAYQEALGLLPTEEDSPLACSLHAGTALVAAAWSRLDEAREAGHRALEMARRTGARREEGVALDALGVAAAQSGDPDTGADLLRRSLALALEEDNPDDVGVVYVNLTHVLGLANRMDELVPVAREGIEAVRRRGLLRQYGGLLMSNLGEALIKSGRLDEAEQTVRTALADLPRGIQAAPALLQSGRLAMIRGDLPLAWERIEQARVIVEAESAPDAWQREVYEALAEAELWSGRPAAAYELAVDGLRLCCVGDEARFGGIMVMLGLRALADQSEKLRPHDHDRKRVRRERAELLDLAGRLDPDPLVHTEGPTAESLPVALTCRAELTRLDGGSAAAGSADRVAAWQRAAESWRAAGRPWGAAYARWRDAEARLRVGVDADTIAALRAAWQQAVALDAGRLQEELRALGRWYRVDLVSTSRTEEPAVPLESFGLTSREREVLAGLAAGRTNQEIADSLFVSSKTASVHVSNILRKMEVSGRQEAARIAHRLGFGRADEG